MDPAEINRYYLQVKKNGDKPKWPRPEEELVVGSQDLGDGYTQYWAYHQDSSRAQDDLPPAEIVASENPTPKPAILVDQPRPLIDSKTDDVLDLILVKDGHAFYYLSSSIASLRDNIETILNASRDEFNMEVEHFMTTGRVADEVEKALDALEDAGDVQTPEEEDNEPEPQPEEEKMNNEEDPLDNEDGGEDEEVSDEEEDLPPPAPMKSSDTEPEEENHTPFKDEAPEENLETLASDEAEEEPENQDDNQTVEPKPTKMADVLSPNEDMGPPIRHVNTHSAPASGIYLNQSRRIEPQSSGGSSKLWLLVPVILLLLAFASVFIFKDRIFTAVNNVSSTPTPTPTTAPTPTPTPPVVKRDDYKVRVLNGTTKAGAAKTLGDSLKEKGWQIDKVGNNTDQTIESGYVRFKESKKDAYPTLLSDLGSGYSASASGFLKDSDTADLEVVIGGK